MGERTWWYLRYILRPKASDLPELVKTKADIFLFIFFSVEESSHLAGVDSQIMKTELWSCIYYLRKLPAKMLSIKLKSWGHTKSANDLSGATS